MKFLYPKKGSNLDQRKNSSIYGNYPLSSYNAWHGGIHEEQALAELVAISDARIIAYKLPSEYLFTAHECPEMYSNGFILIQHDYKSPKEKELTFYSLYHHIASKFDITNSKNNLEVPSFLSKKVTKIKASNTPKGVRGRAASLEEGKTRGTETVLIPKNHIVTRNGVELLADWAKTYNTGKTSEKKKYYSYTYTDPFTNTVYSDIHIYSGCLQLVAGETDKYKVTYDTDTNTTTGKSKKQTDALNAELEDGALLFNIADSDFGFFGKGTCIGVIPKDTEITVIKGSESEDKKWVRVKDSEKEYEGYVQARDFEAQKTFDSDIALDKIVACDIPVKAGEIVAYVGAFGFNKNENNYSSHIELFTDASDTDVSDLLDNCAGDGEENFQRYKMLSGATLEPYVQSSKELKAGTPIRVTSMKGDYVRVKVKGLIKEIDKSKHLAAQQTTNASGKKVYVKDSVCGMSKTRYKIKDTSFDYVNQQFNGLLTKGDFVYYYKPLAGSLREIIIQPPFWNKEFWIDKSHLKVEGDQVVTFGLETTLESDSCHTYIGEPYTPHERGNTFKKERELSGKPQITVTDDDGKLWYFIAESYNFEKECYQHIGWIKAGDAHLELINPFVWSNFGFKTYDAGSEYVYAMKDYHKSEKTDAFIDELWKMVDEDGDGIILSPIEFLRAQRNPYTSERMGKMVVKHKSEWSYEPEAIKSEALEFYKLGLDLEKDPDKKKLLEQKRDTDLEHLVEKTKNLMFWKELQNTTYTPKITEKDKEYEEKKAAIKQKYARFLGEEHMSESSKNEMNVELDVLDQEYKKGKYKEEETRKLPSSDMLWHFNVNSFVRQMRMMYPEGKTGVCSCNRDLTIKEFTRIIKRLRKNEGLGGGTILNHSNCAIPSDDKTFERLTEEFNKTTRKYGINQCIQKIHFITQIYHESARFTTGLEFDTGDYYNPNGGHPESKNNGNTVIGDGPKYKGRGFMQLTWRNTQIKYLKYAAKNSEGILKGKTDTELELRSSNYEKHISDNLMYAMDSAGWFWVNKIHKKKSLLDHSLEADSKQRIISKIINGGKKGIEKRAKYYQVLKSIFRYELDCINNSSKSSTDSLQEVPPWLKVAFSEYNTHLGYIEEEKNLSDRIEKSYFNSTTSKGLKSEIPWCAAFINYCYLKGSPSYKNKTGIQVRAFEWGPANNKHLNADRKNIGGWKEGEDHQKPFLGALAVYSGSHVGFVVGKNSNGKIVLLGGNQNGVIGNMDVSGDESICFSSYPANKISFYMKPKDFIVKSEWKEENLPVIDINNPSETYSSLR